MIELIVGQIEFFYVWKSVFVTRKSDFERVVQRLKNNFLTV